MLPAQGGLAVPRQADRRRPGTGGQRAAVAGHRTFEDGATRDRAQQEQQRIRNARGCSPKVRGLLKSRDYQGLRTRPHTCWCCLAGRLANAHGAEPHTKASQGLFRAALGLNDAHER